MKKISKFFIIALSFVLCASLLALGLSHAKKASAAPANQIFNYISLSEQGKKIEANNFLTVNDESVLFTNSSVTIKFQPFTTHYLLDAPLSEYENDYYITYTSVTIEKNLETETYPLYASFNGITYYFTYDTVTEVITLNTLIGNRPVRFLSSNETTGIVSVSENAEHSILTVKSVETMTPKFNTNSVHFGLVSPVNDGFTIKKPDINFANGTNPVVYFNTYETGNPRLPMIQREQTFSKMKIDFPHEINLTYTESNPLYFNINYNGFIYNFKLYTKTLSGINCLFLDENRDSNAKKFVTDSTTYAATEDLSVIFSETGRYSFEIYDSTYLCGTNNSNYYATSFYILAGENSDYQNIYMIAETLNDDGTPIEYIVSTATGDSASTETDNAVTLNNNVKLKIKNLKQLGENLENVIEKVEVTSVEFGASGNIPHTKIYSPAELLNLSENSDDVEFTFSDDNYYLITVFEKGTNNKKSYNFSIIKKVKASYKVNGQSYIASIPFQIEEKNYTLEINATLKFKVQIGSSSELDRTTNRTYYNNFKIRYGVQEVSLTSVGTGTDETGDFLAVKCQGVGLINVVVEFNGNITNYQINSGENVILREYGTYNITMTDSMGTTDTKTFSLSKQLNTSAYLLIGLSAVVVLVIALFIIIARSKVKTR